MLLLLPYTINECWLLLVSQQKGCELLITFLFFISGVTFFFSEADHSINEGSLPAPPTIIAPLSKNPDTRLACPVIFQVCPITIYEANATGCPIPPGAQLEHNPFSPFKASKSKLHFLLCV